MFVQELKEYVKNKDLVCLFLGNPYCSDDAFGYHLYNELESSEYSTRLKLFYSYNVEVEKILTVLQEKDPSKTVVLIVDTVPSTHSEQVPILQYNSGIQHNISTHKAEWKIVKDSCKKYQFLLALLLIPVHNISYTGEITTLSHKAKRIKQELTKFFLGIS
ncbi:MAG: hypothetical protein FK732_07445 [Asgard group archaeon]|nr:hypothetical protein [Asgard group archaeon]